MVIIYVFPKGIKKCGYLCCNLRPTTAYTASKNTHT